ncbi:hypothetical protein HHK36_024602 [Tetracentron sinense]|uniref:B box-type domain-containing protein n=1 Tax=Tetracentron sinense TaxID=13715 RepID=A0A834YR07_TETSI|nr:hypothetical protein HHK36_024602 [Tetracentron sinense]
MERTCEFCRELRPAIYCKADAARLCLSCDARVHSANALSNRHFRNPICEGCGKHPSSVRCLDHWMFMCRGCDRKLHKSFAQHRKRVISSFMGCPSANDFAALWGYEMNELGDSGLQNQYVSTSFGPVVSGVANLDIPREFHPRIGCSSLTSEVNSMASMFGAYSEVGSSSLESKIFLTKKQQRDTHFILQQILELKRLQLNERNNPPSLIQGQIQTDISSFKDNTLRKVDKDLDQHSRHPKGLGIDLHQMESPHHELQVQHFPLPFSQLEHLSSSSIAGIPLHGDSFWQCKSPAWSSELWTQNMQDLGICEEVDCYDGFNIPDVDLTFQNYEALFGADKDQPRALFDEEDVACSSMEKDMSLDKSDNFYSRAIEDISVASSIYITRSSYEDRNIGPSDQSHHFSGSVDSLHPNRPSYSTLSFSLSRLNAESSAADYLDNGLSPNGIRGAPPWNSPDLETEHAEARENSMRRCEKPIRCASLKAKSDVRQRVNGRIVKAEGYESDTFHVTQSY